MSVTIKACECTEVLLNSIYFNLEEYLFPGVRPWQYVLAVSFVGSVMSQVPLNCTKTSETAAKMAAETFSCWLYINYNHELCIKFKGELKQTKDELTFFCVKELAFLQTYIKHCLKKR